jgi:hypothetical protein
MSSIDNTANRAGLLPFVPGATRSPEPKRYSALDLGQRHDHSAHADLELFWHDKGVCRVTYARLFQPEIAIRSLYRFPLGTSYEDVIDETIERLAIRPWKSELIIDAGGPGPPIVDRFRKTLPRDIKITPVVITGGKGKNKLTNGYTAIPRRSLITNLLLTMSQNAIYADEGMPNWKQFEEELINLRGDSTHPEGGSAHDDLVMAVALALSAALRDVPMLLPPSDEGEKPTKYGFIDKPLF